MSLLRTRVSCCCFRGNLEKNHTWPIGQESRTENRYCPGHFKWGHLIQRIGHRAVGRAGRARVGDSRLWMPLSWVPGVYTCFCRMGGGWCLYFRIWESGASSARPWTPEKGHPPGRLLEPRAAALLLPYQQLLELLGTAAQQNWLLLRLPHSCCLAHPHPRGPNKMQWAKEFGKCRA